MSIIRADSIKNRGGNGAPDFPKGLTVTGVITATTLNQNVTGDINVGSNIKIGAASGIVTATTFKGNVTGDVTGAASQLSTNATGANLTLSGNLGVGGTLTYEDVTRVDATGLSTFREGLEVGPLAGIAATVYTDGSIRTVGVITATNFYGDGSNLSGIDASALKSGGAVKVQANSHGAVTTGVMTATSFAGDGSALSGLSTPLSHRNKLINGDFSVWQRGTSSTANGYNTADRWHSTLSGGSATFSRETFAGGSEIAGSTYYFKINTTSGNDNLSIMQKIEDVRTIEPGTWTLSFWAKHTGAGPSGGVVVRGDQSFGSGGSGGVSLTTPAAQNTTTSWVRYSYNLTIPSLSGKTIGNNSYLSLEIGQGSNAGTAAWNLDLANFQFEKGSTATAFEKRTYAEELILCMRYYQLSAPGDSSWKTRNWQYTQGSKFSGGNYGDYWQKFIVSMRTSPTVTHYDYSNNSGKLAWERPGHSGNNNGTINSNEATPSGIHIRNTNMSALTGSGGSNSEAFIYSNWEASAEL